MFATLFVRAGDVVLFGGESRGGRVGGGVGLCCERAGGGGGKRGQVADSVRGEGDEWRSRVFGRIFAAVCGAEPIAGECHRGSAGRNGTKYGG